MHVAERNTEGDASPAFGVGRKISEVEQVMLWNELQEDPQGPSRPVMERMAARQAPLRIGVRQVNRWRVRWQGPRHRGRPRQAAVAMASSRSGAPVAMERLTHVGVHLWAAWLEPQAVLMAMVAQLQSAITAYRAQHPEADFPLLHHKPETLRRRLAALWYAPLLGVAKLTEFDVRETPLPTLVGRGYQSSTLNQFLGQLERIAAGPALMAALVPAAAGQLVYIDGHMIAYWATVAMHKGKITMLGRIMAGTHAVIAHNEAGLAVRVEHHPPDVRLPSIIIDYCEPIVAATGITLFVIDREINSVAMAAAFAERGWGLLSMLDKNEYAGLTCWATTRIGETAAGSPIYSGQWKTPRADDVREFVLVETGERVLAYWGTAKFKAAFAPVQWPELYRARTAVQEHNFKRMIEHGALNCNYGTKKVLGPDRHQQRARQALEEALAAAQHKMARKAAAVQAQAEKVGQSQRDGHTRRLGQRQQALMRAQADLKKATDKVDALAEPMTALGPAVERADRDVRKQTIMTVRTLLLENMLRLFIVALWGVLTEKMSLESLLPLLFARSGARDETAHAILYWVNTAGLSAINERKLVAVVQGLTALNLTCRGKPIHICLRKAPP
jgi:hypothetical protein